MLKLPAIKFQPKFLFIPVIIVALTATAYFFQNNLFLNQKLTGLGEENSSLILKSKTLNEQMQSLQVEFDTFKNQDQVKRNDELEKEISEINKTYKNAVSVFEKILDLKNQKAKTEPFEIDFAKTLSLLAERKYTEAEGLISEINKKIESEKTKIAASVKIPENIPVDNTPPQTGYKRQSVQTDQGSFMVDIISADLNSTKVIVDTASDSDCANDCPVLSLSDYVSRSGAFAGVNGSYFCPATYPQCAGKTNTFDILLMNKNKTYFNSANNVYSSVPAVIFSGSSARFVRQSSDWGRDTGVDAVIANRPLLVYDSQVQFTEGEGKEANRGGRSFVGATGSTVYIGVVHNATVAQAAKAVQTLGITQALNLDDGGSTALWYGGYKAGPGRNLPNALLFVRK